MQSTPPFAAVTRARRGFTLIELLTVVAIMGLLAALALPRMQALTDKGRIASLISDVRNAEFAEESYFADHGDYADLDDMETGGTLKLSPGVTMTASPTAAGYSIAATNLSISRGPSTCSVELGDSATPGVDGKIICE